MIKQELAWAAGFFDGEGHVASYIDREKYHGPYIRISITQTDTEVLDRFNKAVLGLGKVCGPYAEKNPNAKDKYILYVTSFEKVQAVMGLLWNFLSSIKRAQFKNAHLSFLQAVEKK